MPASKDLVSTLQDGYVVWFARQHNNPGRPRKMGDMSGKNEGGNVGIALGIEKERETITTDNCGIIT